MNTTRTAQISHNKYAVDNMPCFAPFAAIMILFCLLLLSSCDILRSSPYVVEAWTPGEGFHNDPGRIRVSLLLSNESDRVKTEQAFSLAEDGRTLKGSFSWEGSRLVFIPASPLEADRDYVLSLGTGAQDSKGISLENKFEVSFTTRIPGGKPRLTGTEPEHEAILYESRGELRLFFSEQVRLNSCMDNIYFSPSAPGSWRLEDDSKTACFIPREPWQPGTLYQVSVESSFAFLSGSVLGNDYSSVFSAGEDREKPVLLKVLALFPEEEPEGVCADEIPFETSGLSSMEEYAAWENFTRLCLVFSEPVDLSGIKNLLVIEPSLSLAMESSPEFIDRAVFRFTENPEWGSSFLFRLTQGVKDRAGNESGEEYIFKIRIAGPLSKPPALTGIRLPMAPGNSADQEALVFSPGDIFADLPINDGKDRYPFGSQTPAWIELYFETAPETWIDPFSVMDLFRVESTNQALVFSPRNIRTESFTLAAPAPGWETLRRFEIRGFVANTVYSGIVTFRIPPGLMDKRGNKSAVDFRISLLK
jgi:hypothetical protein